MQFGTGWRWMYSDAMPIARDENGRATRLIGTQVGITQLRHARNALEASEAQFRAVLEDAPVCMAVMDERGSFIGVNGALAQLCGYEASVLRNEVQLSDLLVRRDFVQMSRDVRNQQRKDGGKTYQDQLRLRTRNGEVRWGLFNLSWTYDKNRSENVYIAQIVDITDQKRLEQIKNEFVATVSHELRTPLTSLKGALGLLEVEEEVPESAARLLEIARVNADRLGAIVNDILDLEKISSGDVRFEFGDTALDDLIADTVALMEPVAAAQRKTLVRHAGDHGILVHFDAGRIRQFLSHLVSNACKFSDPQTQVTLRYERQKDCAIIYVENTGPLVPEGFRAQMFEAFTQADGSDTRSKGGTGLGLNIAREIVKRQGGQIGFEQFADRRTVFWFTCPLSEMDAAVDRPALPPDAPHVLYTASTSKPESFRGL